MIYKLRKIAKIKSSQILPDLQYAGNDYLKIIICSALRQAVKVVVCL